MNIKRILFKINNNNFRACLGLTIAFIILIFFTTFKLFSHVEIHAEYNPEIIEMEHKANKIQEKQKEIEEKYKDNIQNAKSYEEYKEIKEKEKEELETVKDNVLNDVSFN